MLLIDPRLNFKHYKIVQKIKTIGEKKLRENRKKKHENTLLKKGHQRPPSLHCLLSPNSNNRFQVD